jgi:hypothetical protein
LIRIGVEPDVANDGVGMLSYEECLEESRLEEIPGLEWEKWDVCGLKGGSREGREHGWFVVQESMSHTEEEESKVVDRDQS